MLRAAAKNHMAVLPVCDPEDYPRVLPALEEGPSREFRRELACPAFAHTASYAAAIAEWLAGEKFPPEKFLVLRRTRNKAAAKSRRRVRARETERALWAR